MTEIQQNDHMMNTKKQKQQGTGIKTKESRTPENGEKWTRWDKIRSEKIEGQRSCHAENEAPAEDAEKPQTFRMKHQKRTKKHENTREKHEENDEESKNNNKNQNKMKNEKRLKTKRPNQ